MRLKGMEIFREKLPAYSGKKIYFFLILSFLTIISSIIFQLIMDSSSRLFIDLAILQILAPFTPIIGSGLILTIGFSLVYTFWRLKEKLLTKDKVKAYQKALPIALIGIPLVISFVVHGFLPNDFLIPNNDSSTLSWYLNIPVYEIFFETPSWILYIRIIVFIIFLILGLIVVFKSLMVFGIDNMGLVYVYYPEESKMEKHEIYSILRHPTYHGLVMLLIGSFFLRFSIYSIIFLFMFLIGINIHLKFVEEKELIRRFGEEYKSYQENVPAMFLRPKDLKKYIHFLLK